MNQCLSCQGVVPAGLAACPNCAVTRRKTGLKAAALGLVAIAVSNCGSAMALYGIPCTSKQVDGGANGCPGECTTLLPDGGDPRKDATNACFTDGGTP
ncbi:MAG: hypothetical protein IAE78_20120 [Myxococcus sp.]|nr:hypothetical protein [Myxococcus sp.]